MPVFPYRQWLLVLLLLTAFSLRTWANEVIPQVPARYFNDYALTVKPETADALNRKLENLEKETSNQILAVIYPKMETESSIEDYTHRIYASWHIGQKASNNAAVLFVFVQDHKMRIETGRGLEGPLPDSVCKDIIADQIAPHFKAGDYDGGLTAGVDSLIKATKGEYKGTGQTQYQRDHAHNGGGLSVGTIFAIIVVFLVLSTFFRRRGGGAMYTGGGPIFFPIGFGGGGSSSSSDRGSSGDGGFFAGGGGDSGAGGGASGDW